MDWRSVHSNTISEMMFWAKALLYTDEQSMKERYRNIFIIIIIIII